MLDWLSRARFRDVFLVLLGIIGLLTFSSLFIARRTHIWTTKEELNRQEEWRRWEEETHRQLAQQGGVRSIELSSSTTNPQVGADLTAIRPPIGYHGLTLVSLELRSEPVEAEVFLDWVFKGKTPLRLEGEKIHGLLVVVKDDHQAWFRQVSYQTSDVLDLNLPLENPRSRTHLLLLVSGESSGDFFSSLKDHLMEEGFAVLGPEEAGEFEQAFGRAGGISRRALRAWARVRFDTDLLITAQVHQSSRELSEREMSFPGIREAVKGTVRAEVSVELEVVDLRFGNHLSAVSSKGADFALDPAQSIQKALTQVAADVAKKLRQQILK